ncbi:M81 family metallopeptidase [Psychromicrobium xiongbiense]|uniref:M81 family metallopeptidase n=1 Tax=Psychromicrobium xiongbiense TaxID=3051184 RepID=UPI002552DC30|nr:M81 family metallopeptidase [Psychromicrobium sp. YIM S02556]
MTLPRIAIAGIALEASTYSPARTTEAGFVRRDGEQIMDYYEFFAPGQPVRETAQWLPLVHFRSIPGGAVPLEDYQSMKATICSAVAAAVTEGPLDGFYVDLHGAMSVVGLDDPEGDLILALRELTGPETVFASGMDLHGNVSPVLAWQLDVPSCYRMAPHEDWLETKERTARNLLSVIDSGQRPLKAWIPVPILLPGEKTSTRDEPAKSLYRQVAEIAELPEVLDAALWIGYAWADEPRNHAVIMVTGDDWEVISTEAQKLARQMWDRREEFHFVAPAAPLDECLDAMLASDKRPYFLSDSGDNPTAGGAGDVTWTLAQLLAEPRLEGQNVIYASIPDAEAARECWRIAQEQGLGSTVTVTIGARVDDRPHPPVTVTGVIKHVVNTDPVAGIEVVLSSGPVNILLTERRKPYHLESDFTRNGLNPREADLVVVKIGYLEPELFAMSQDWMLALTPGGVDQDLIRLGHHRIKRPMFPYESDFAPDLHARHMPESRASWPGDDTIQP